ncbi:collagen-binding domain-containing protein [Paludisphaera soli]|uniref:collagen-binding domain-containing protein n=1 Tax=Paludisphaera soli TaxID=2712865 RepID=UPI0013ED32C6|nr:collagen-binding domain-containing protein [Paludisphaera soli]
MTKRAKVGLILSLTTMASTVAATPSRADLLTNWSLVTTGDLYAGHNVQGTVRVGGGLYVQNSFEVASKPSSPELKYPSLLVGGDVKAGKNPETVKILRGDGVIGGTINGASDNKARIVSARDGGVVKVDPGAAGFAASDDKELKASSQAFKEMKDEGQSVVLSTKQVDTARFTVMTVDSNGNAVFHVDGERLFENNKVRGFSLDLNGYKFGEGQSVVFNVSGVDLDFRNGLNFDGAFRTSFSNILWNFYEAGEIDLNRNNFAGTLLAPDALLTDNNTIDGSVFVKSFGTSYKDGMGAGIRGPLYAGYDPSTVRIESVPIPSTPEPSGLAMAGLAVLCGAAWRIRRRV